MLPAVSLAWLAARSRYLAIWSLSMVSICIFPPRVGFLLHCPTMSPLQPESVHHESEIYILRGDHGRASRQDGSALQHMFQFADVARPVVPCEFGHGPGLEALYRLFASHPFQEMIHQHGQVLAVIGKGGSADEEDGQPVVE